MNFALQVVISECDVEGQSQVVHAVRAPGEMLL
jgi:hypothetical protein